MPRASINPIFKNLGYNIQVYVQSLLYILILLIDAPPGVLLNSKSFQNMLVTFGDFIR